MGEPMRALIVDDNIALARVTQFAFERAGFETAVAANGRSALDIALDQDFDLIVTDQQMPVMTGVEFCRELRTVERYRETPIIMLTAKGLEMELGALRDELDIQALFAKPFSPSAVVEAAARMTAAAV